MSTKTTCVAVLAILASPSFAQDDPGAAIGWLRDALQTPSVIDEPAARAGAAPVAIQSSEISDTTSNATGLLPRHITGLPRDTFAGSEIEQLVQVVDTLRSHTLPALQDLQVMLLLAELDPPSDDPTSTRFLRARVDALVRFGALDQAQAMLDNADWATRDLFDLYFDIALLTGADGPACDALSRTPTLSQDLSARAFCAARGGDVGAAYVTLDTGRAIGLIPDEDADLLTRFLDPEAFEGMPLAVPSGTMTPLRYRLLDGLGEPPVTGALPRPFAMADLRDQIGWKAQLEAAERLAQSGAIAMERLRGLYSERMPAASGGVWDRVESYQVFDTALSRGDPGAVARALPEVWEAMTQNGLRVQFARLHFAALQRLPLPAEVSDLVFRIGLLSDAFEEVAQSQQARPDRPLDEFAVSVARGMPEVTNKSSGLHRAIAAGFDGQPGDLAAKVAQSRLGEALFSALEAIQHGAGSDLGDITTSLRLLNAVGLRSTAREAALQMLLLEGAG